MITRPFLENFVVGDALVLGFLYLYRSAELGWLACVPFANDFRLAARTS